MTKIHDIRRPLLNLLQDWWTTGYLLALFFLIAFVTLHFIGKALRMSGAPGDVIDIAGGISLLLLIISGVAVSIEITKRCGQYQWWKKGLVLALVGLLILWFLKTDEVDKQVIDICKQHIPGCALELRGVTEVEVVSVLRAALELAPIYPDEFSKLPEVTGYTNCYELHGGDDAYVIVEKDLLYSHAERRNIEGFLIKLSPLLLALLSTSLSMESGGFSHPPNVAGGI